MTDVGRARLLYGSALALGVVLLFFIYGKHFNDLSESRLVLLSFVWFFPVVFGVYGLVGQATVKRREAPPAPASTEGPEKAATAAVVGGAVGAIIIRVIFRRMPPIISLGLLLVLGLFMLPLFLIKKGSALRIATVGTAMWIPLLVAFLVFVFPSL